MKKGTLDIMLIVMILMLITLVVVILLIYGKNIFSFW